MTVEPSLLADYREPHDAGFAWNMHDGRLRWSFQIDVPATLHEDGLLAVEHALDELALALTFAVERPDAIIGALAKDEMR